jgi:hypothetical protein
MSVSSTSNDRDDQARRRWSISVEREEDGVDAPLLETGERPMQVARQKI